MRIVTYQVLLTPDSEDGGWSVSVPDLPGCFTFGDTYSEAIEMAEDAIKTYAAALLLDGDPLPEPSVVEKRAPARTATIQVEVDENYIVARPNVPA